MSIATNSLNGNVQSRGIKIDHSSWLDMGSIGWGETSKEIKAQAYQIAREVGWTDEGLKKIILTEFAPRLDHFWADLIIENLQTYAKEYPIEIKPKEEVKLEIKC